ncbi:MAG TPA: ankyrin repeat domain-containing protein [Steroidobacteraceae bacterium]
MNSSAEESDEALVGRYVRGDAAAFDLLYRRHELRVWRYLERNVRSQANSDELLQEIWFALSRNAASLESATRFRTRLFTLTHDRMSNSVRERPPAVVEPPSGRLPRDPAGLALAVGLLPREQREAFLLQSEGQLSVGEIAEITEASIDATQSTLRQAKLQLRELLSEAEAPANPDDFSDVDQNYRRLSGMDPGRPGEWVRRKVQAYSAQQAAERSVRESSKGVSASPAVVAPPTPRVTPAPAAAPRAAAAEPKQSGSKPWLLPVVGAGIVVVLAAVFVVPSLRAPGGTPTVTPPPPPPILQTDPTAPTAQSPSTQESVPPPAASQPAEPEVAASTPPPPAPTQAPAPAPVAQAEEPRTAAQPAPSPAGGTAATNPTHTQPQPKPRVATHPAVTPPPTPPAPVVANNRPRPDAQPLPAAPPANNPAPVVSSAPAASPPPAQPAAVAAVTPPPPAPTPVAAAPAAPARPLPPSDDFYKAAETGDLGRVNEVLAEGNVDVNMLDAKGRSPLILAISRGHVEIVKALLAHGADPAKADGHGVTPKAAAYSRGNFEITRALERARRH